MHLSVVMDGVLQGMGRTAACSFVAEKDWSPGGADQARYRHCSVVSAPAELPDGIYLLHFEGYLTCVERRRGHWIRGERPVRSLKEEAPGEHQDSRRERRAAD